MNVGSLRSTATVRIGWQRKAGKVPRGAARNAKAETERVE
jgi:hypothetical protein